MDDPDSSLRERLKASLWHRVGTLINAASENQGHGQRATAQFTAALTELVWTQIESVATDLQAFACHAGRSTVTTEDVLLLARRNEALESILRAWVEERRGKEAGKKSRGRVGGGSKLT